MGKNESALTAMRLRSNAATLERFAEAMEVGRLKQGYEILQEAGTTSDFPILMGNAQNRVLQQSYRAVPDQWRGLCRSGTIADFREKEIIRISEADDLDEIQEMGEVKDSTLSEAKETTSLSLFAKRFSVSWKTVVNDDLDAIRRQPERFGRAAARKINQLVFNNVLAANPTMSDGIALFHANHGNLGSTGLSESSLQAALTAIRHQTDDRGNKIAVLANLPTLLVPPALEWTAAKLVNTSLVPATSIGGQILGDINTLRGRCKLQVADWLDDANDWYVVADPNDIDTIQVDFLRMIGEAPQLFMKDQGWMFVGGGQAGIEQFDHEYLVRHVVTAKAVDWRGMYKAVVAA